MQYISKRDGSIVPFDEGRIISALQMAFTFAGPASEDAEHLSHIIAQRVTNILENKTHEIGYSVHGAIPNVEDVQNVVEEALMRGGHYEVAKAYILYRNKHAIARQVKSKTADKMKELFGDSQDSDLKRDNANVDGNSSMGTMLQVGAVASKDYYAEHFLTKEQAEANSSGEIHIHDFDFFALTLTCCQIDLLQLFHGGFSTGHGYLREPNSIASYSALACIAIQSNQNDQHGGQGIPNFDYAMAEGVRKSYRKDFIGLLTVAYEDLADREDRNSAIAKSVKETEDEMGTHVSMGNDNDFDVLLQNKLSVIDDVPASVLARIISITRKRALVSIDTKTHQAMESFIHNLNSMHSRAGAQVPFSSINYGTDISAEGRLVVKNVLKATEEGLGHGETPIFPIQIFKMKEGINYNKEDPNYDLFKLACKVSAKRLFPNFLNLDAPFNAQFYIPGRPETEVATMGCRTRVMNNVHDTTKQISHGRGNLSFTSINLPRIAIMASGNTQKFYAMLEEKMDLVARQLYDRFEIQGRRKVYNYPFLMGQNVWLDADTLKPDDEIREVIKHGSLSFGFIGLAEALVALFGKHHGESEAVQEKGLEIIGFMREFTDKKAADTGLNYSLLATPAEGLSGYFVKKDKALFGVIPGVTDKEYYTNSFHIPVKYEIGVFDKIRLEAPYHELTNAGHITYVELDGDTADNEEAFETIVKCMHDANIGYGSINHPVDRDPICGYVGIINDTCPRCGRKEGEAVSMELLEKISRIYSNVPFICGIE